MSLALVGIAAFACASAGNHATGREACVLAPGDSVFGRSPPLYRDCAVDHAAQLVTTNGHPDFRPASFRDACYFADLEFVVDTAGRPEMGTARVIRSNERSFGDAVLAWLETWKYQPALLSGKHVRQIVTTHQRVSTQTVVVPAGQPPPGGPPRNRPETC